MAERVDTVVIGAGQAGLSTSFFLKRDGVEHVVLERDAIGSSWRRRWDSFTLVTPNAMNALPEFTPGGEPDGFLPRDEVVRYLERFAASFSPPLRTGVRVSAVTPLTSTEAEAARDATPGDATPGGPRLPGSASRGERFVVQTDRGAIRCRNVVVATGTFQHPRVPECATSLPADILQLHSSEYRNPGQLPGGAVLVVGSGQSGAQIADDLRGSGRQVYLSVSRANRVPRRYRGRDTFAWLRDAGLFERTLDMLDSPAERFEAHPHVSGRDGGRTLNLRRFGREGVVLAGKVKGSAGGRIFFHGDLEENLRKADEFAAGVCARIDEAVEKKGLEAPTPTEAEVVPETWSPPESVRELSLEEAGIRTVVWATGFRFDFGWIGGCALDRFGYPVQRQGVTPHSGLYFVGLHWLHRHKSGLLYGVAEDAEHVAGHVMGGA